MLPDKLDYVPLGLSRLKSQRRGKLVIEGLMISWLEQIQDIEDTGEHYKNLSIYNATNSDLDRIGRLFGVGRLSRDDDDYRLAILSFIASTSPECTVDGIMSAVKAYGNTDFVDLWEHFPAHQEVYMGAGFSPDMYTVLNNMVPAGTSVRVLIDDEGDSLVMAEEAPISQVLINNEGDVVTVEDEENIPKKLLVSSLGDFLEFHEGRSQFAEEGDLEFTPFAEELYRGVLYESGNIIDDLGNFIVDDNGNNIIYRDFRFL